MISDKLIKHCEQNLKAKYEYFEEIDPKGYTYNL